MTLDEVQREPRLLHAVQPAIDGDRTPGRFLLTGSANLLLMRQISESLAGRASYLTLWPMMRLIAYKFAPAMTRGQLLNQTEPARDVSLPQPTVRGWLNLLETSYMLVRLPAYAVTRTKRLVKSPKLYWADTGLALHLGKAAIVRR